MRLVFDDGREVRIDPARARQLADLLWDHARVQGGSASAAAAIQQALTSRPDAKVDLDSRESRAVSDKLQLLSASNEGVAPA